MHPIHRRIRANTRTVGERQPTGKGPLKSSRAFVRMTWAAGNSRNASDLTIQRKTTGLFVDSGEHWQCLSPLWIPSLLQWPPEGVHLRPQHTLIKDVLGSWPRNRLVRLCLQGKRLWLHVHCDPRWVYHDFHEEALNHLKMPFVWWIITFNSANQN